MAAKFKRRKHGGTPKLPRAAYVQFAVDQSAQLAEVTFDAQTGEFSFRTTDGSVLPLRPQAGGVAALRTGRLKPLTAVPTTAANMNPAVALNQFETIVAVDATPIDEAAGRYLIALAQLFVTGSGWEAKVAVVFDIHGVRVNAERLGWKLAADEVMVAAGYRDGESVLIVTDHDRDTHQAINNRTAAALGEWMLPPGFQLAYSSDRSPSDSPLQGALHLCHQWGTTARGDHPSQPPFASDGDPRYTAATRFVLNYDAQGVWDRSVRVGPVLSPAASAQSGTDQTPDGGTTP